MLPIEIMDRVCQQQLNARQTFGLLFSWKLCAIGYLQTTMWTTLKKFSLEYDDFPTMMQNVSHLLKGLTVNIYKKSINHVGFLNYASTTITGFSYVYVYVFSIYWMVFCRYGLTADLNVIASVASINLCSITCFTKLVFMKIYANDIKNTVHQLLKCYTKVIPGTRFAKNLRKNLRVVKKRAIVIWIIFVMIGVIYVVIPLFRPGRHLPLDTFIIYGLEPMFESPNFEIATFVTAFSVYFAVYVMATIAVYVIVVVGYNEAQILALGEELKNVWNDSENFYKHIKHKVTDKIHAIYIKEKIVNEFIRIRLRDIIKFHARNINLMHELNNEFRPTLALEYTIMAISIISELLGGLEYTALNFLYTLVQIFMDCLAGQRLVDACDNFERTLYSCKWENFNMTNRKTVYLMLMMSQKTLVLSAGGVTRLDFNCFMNILKSTYSAYTTLKSAWNK